MESTAIELGKKGIVLLGDFDDKGLVKAKEELEMLNIEVYTMHMDVRDKESCVSKQVVEYTGADEYTMNAAKGVEQCIHWMNLTSIAN